SLAGIIQLVAVGAKNWNRGRNSILRPERSQLTRIRRGIEVNDQNKTGRSNADIRREIEIHRLSQPPRVRGPRRVEERNAGASDVVQLDELINGIVRTIAADQRV